MDSKRSTQSIWIPVVIVALLLVGGVAWHLWQRNSQSAAPASAVTAQNRPPTTPVGQSMPSIQQADERVRSAAAGLSTSSKFKEWLGVGDLARKFVATVNSIADGASPRAVLAFLAPSVPFKTERHHHRTFIAPASFGRYDEVASVIDSIDAKAAARAYQALHPLLIAAYKEIGKPGTTLDGRLEEAIQRLLTTPALPNRVEVKAASKGIAWEFTDARLEGMSPASKHLLRMGPKNERLIQAKLREFAAEFHLSPVAAAGQDRTHHPG